MNFMRAGPQLGVDASGVSGFTRLCRSASSPSQHSFCARYCEENTLADAFFRSTKYTLPI